jgi:hypothetical protein
MKERPSNLNTSPQAVPTPQLDSGAKTSPMRAPNKALDVGTMWGPEIWRVIREVEFSHWDRWLLRLATTEPNGLDSIEAAFRGRRKSERGAGSYAEAMLSQLDDLKNRLTILGQQPSDVLSEEERASEWLFKKAFKRVWHSGPHRKTRAMVETPRWRLERRALRGHWSRFPVSPSEFERELSSIVGPEHAYLDYRVVDAVARALDAHAGFLAVGASREQRLALYRCAMTVVIDAMGRADDSGADLAVAFRAFELAYLELAIDFVHEPYLLEDLIDLAVWEDYGLLHRAREFLSTLPERHADAVVRYVARQLVELRRVELDHQAEKATRLRDAALQSLRLQPGISND